MDKNEAQNKIESPVAKYEAEKTAGKIDRYSEGETRRGFI